MAYQSWSVVFGEQPSASKWNILGTNDASFNDGTGIDSLALNTTALSNPYKFSVYRNAALIPADNATIVFDSERFDTNNNYDTSNGRYTAPVNGFYWINAGVYYSISSSGSVAFGFTFSKNGTKVMAGHRLVNMFTGSTTGIGANAGIMLQLTAGDYIEVKAITNGLRGIEVGSDDNTFEGFLLCRT